MIDCEELVDDLRIEARSHVSLALLADAASVAGMHLDLAQFHEEQAIVAEELCFDD